MDTDDSANRARTQPRLFLWPYWVFVPAGALTYAAYCTWILYERWERAEQTKPAWFNLAYEFAVPGMFVIPIPVIGPLLIGAGVSFGAVSLVQLLVISRSPPG